MLNFLSAILCAIENLALSVLAVIVMAFNSIIVAIGGLITALVLLLPSMPDAPPSPDSGVLGYLNWLVNLPALIALWTTLITLWLAVLAIRIAMRWVKAF